MANQYNNNPITLDSDMASPWKTLQSLYASAAAAVGIRPYKITIIANTTTSAGQLSFTDGGGTPLSIYPPVAIPSGQVAGTVLYTDNIDDFTIKWHNFKITGQTACGVTVWIWYRV